MMILSGNHQTLDLTATIKSPNLYESSEKFSKLNLAQQTALLSNGISDTYVAKKADGKQRPVTMWLVADVTTAKGRKLVRNAMKFIKSTEKSRLAVVHNPVSEKATSPIVKAVESAVLSQPDHVARKLVAKLLSESNSKKILEGSLEELLSDNAVDKEAFMKLYNKEGFANHVTSQISWCNKVLGLKVINLVARFFSHLLTIIF